MNESGLLSRMLHPEMILPTVHAVDEGFESVVFSNG